MADQSDDPRTWFPIAPAGSKPSTTSVETDADDPRTWFPIAKNAAPAQPSGPPVSLPSTSEFGDMGTAWWNTQAQPPANQPAAPPEVMPVAENQAAAGRIGQATLQGWRGTNLLTPEAEAENQKTIIGKYVSNPLAWLEELPLKAAGAVGGAIGQGAREAGQMIGGQPLAGDLPILLQFLPEYNAAKFAGTRLPGEPPPSAPSPKFMSERMAPPRPPGMTDLERANQLIQHDTAEVAGKGPEPVAAATVTAPSASAPATTAAEAADNSAWVGKTIDQIGNVVQENAAQGGPSSLSAAATPEQLAAMSPNQAKAYRRMAEVNRAVSPIEGEDTREIVPGSKPTQAEAKGDPVVSQQEKLVRDRRPEMFGGPDGRLTQNTNARVQLYDDQTLSDPQIDTLNEDQKAQAKADTAKILAVAKPVDGTPVEAQVQGVLNNPRTAQREDVVKVMKPILAKLYDSDGNLRTDPQEWWGIHDDLTSKLAKAKDPLNASGSEKFAFDQLLDAKNAVDGVLNTATDGAFQTFLDNQSAFFQQKNAAMLLRDFRTKMIDPKTGSIYANKFHRFVTDLAVRRGKPGIDPAMDIPDEVFGKMLDINDDLKRAGRIDLGSPRGSPTNLYFELANGLGIVGAHSLMQAAGGGPVGSLLMQGGMDAVRQKLANFRLNRLVDNALNYPPQAPPPAGQFVPPAMRNPLQLPPPQP